jgi:hypothetical protein
MITLADLRPGDLMFGWIGDEYPRLLPKPLRFMPGRFPVGAGQWLLADRKARLSYRRWRMIRHAGVVVREGHVMPALGRIGTTADLPHVVEAMPRGARLAALTERRWTKEYVYVRPDYSMQSVPAMQGMLRSQADAVADRARHYIGTPYNFLTYGKLAAAHFGLPISTQILRKWISTRKDMMCSQLVDQCLADAGYHVFDDGRLPGDVVPAELFRALLDAPGTTYVVPGMDAWADAPVWWE